MSRHRPSSGPWEHPPVKRERDRAPFSLIFVLFLLICLTLLVFNKAIAQAAYDQINAGRSAHACGAC